LNTATIEQTEAAEVTAAPCVRFTRKTKQDAWRLYGPSELVVEGPVTATRKNGTTSVKIVLGVGKEFLVDGVAHRYGYLTPKADDPTPAPEPSPTSDLDFMPDDFAPADDVADPADWE
jgi:hypothetical protein